MKVHVINSGSSGNCYLLTDSQNNTLILECGKNTFDEALAAVPDVTKIVGGIISHWHRDHNGDESKWISNDVIFWSAGNYTHGEQINLGKNSEFSVIPLEVQHDPGIKCYSFFIRSNVDGKIIYFATDCFSYARQIQAMKEPLSLAMIEVNHDAHMLDTGKYPMDLKERVARTHCSVQRAALAIHGAKCTRFLLIHPSENNLDKEQALKQLCSEFPNREFTFALPGTTLHI